VTADPLSPVFVRGFSRSGGTLVVTLLDAHPRIAMSYEQYPDLLATRDGSPVDLPRLARGFAAAASRKEALATVADKNLHTFFARAWRGGLDHRQRIVDLGEHAARGMGLVAMADRLHFIESLCLAKMRRVKKPRWGLKCENQFEDYLALWPAACFINVVRDGRDVLASQFNTGAFHPDPAAVGRSWSETILKFRGLASRPGVRAHELVYERLVREPEAEVRALCRFLGEEFHPPMLEFHRQDLTIYKANHLSMNRITQPIDGSKIGRWRTELSGEQLRSFYAAAGEVMELLGYPKESDADRSAGN